MDIESVTELSNKTIKNANIITDDQTGDKFLLIEMISGEKYRVSAWQNEGYPTDMVVVDAT